MICSLTLTKPESKGFRFRIQLVVTLTTTSYFFVSNIFYEKNKNFVFLFAESCFWFAVYI